MQVRLQHDFYVTGKAEPLEGWCQISGSAIGQVGPRLLLMASDAF